MRSALPLLLLTMLALALPASASAGCRYADGTAAPEPGFSQDAMNSRTWGPTFATLFNALSKGDKSIVAAILEKPGAVILTSRCSKNDLFWTHLSLVGMSEEAPEAVPAAAADFGRAYRLTEQGSQQLPLLLRASAIEW